jgi:hypothetical protein
MTEQQDQKNSSTVEKGKIQNLKEDLEETWFKVQKFIKNGF